jgi:two-component system sensor histidine kinase/response regulator
MQMPVMDGLAATKAIRQNPSYRALPIIAMTANAMEADKQRCLEAGMNDHIAKPIEPKTMLQTIHRYCKANSADAATAETSVPTQILKPVAVSENDATEYDAMILDVNIGIKHTNDNPSLLLKLYNHFIKDHEEPCTKALERALTTEDKCRWAHTLKGNAAALGAMPLAEIAKTVEFLYKENLAPTADLMQDLESARAKALRQMIEARDQLNAALMPSNQESLGPEALAAALQTLSEQLEQFDPVATDTYNTLAPSLTALEIAESSELEQAIHNFDFAIAADLVLAIRTRITTWQA